MYNELINTLGKPFFRWELDKENNWLYLNWIGYISDENGRNATKLFLELLREHQCTSVLNDNREVCGPWGGGEAGSKWLQETVFPAAAALGLKYMAHILAPNIAAALSSQDLHRRVDGHFEMRIFGEMEKGKAWLRQNQAAEPDLIKTI